MNLLPHEWSELISRIEDLWPGTKGWSKADNLYAEFRPYSKEIISQAIGRLFAEGRQVAPSPSALMGVVRENSPQIGFTGPCSHPWQAHIRPSDIGAEPLLTGEKGPGRLECAGCHQGMGVCRCADCCADPMYAV